MFIRSVVKNLGQRSLPSNAGLKVGGDPTSDKEVEVVFSLLLLEDNELSSSNTRRVSLPWTLSPLDGEPEADWC